MSLLAITDVPQSIRYDEEIPEQFLFFELNREYVAYLSQNIKPPHRHPYQEVIWIRTASAAHLLDGEVVEFPAQTLLIIPKGRIHRFIPSLDCLGCVIRFNEEFLQNPSHLLFTQFAGHASLQLTQQEAGGFEAYLSLLRYEYEHTNTYHLHTLRKLLAAFVAKLEELCQLHSMMASKDAMRTLNIWNHFNIIMEQKFKTEHAVTFYASELGLSPRKLGEVTKLYTGKNVSEVIDARLITEAKRLLIFSSLAIKEISFELGFEEPSYFSKVFKKLTGETPSNFKRINSHCRKLPAFIG